MRTAARPTAPASALTLVVVAALGVSACSAPTTETDTVDEAPATVRPTDPSSAASGEGHSEDAEDTETAPSAAGDDDAETATGPAQDASAEPTEDTSTERVDPGPVAAALALVPADSGWVTLTDWSAIKARLGAAELTSESIMTDRLEFWRGLPSGTVLLTEGALRPENSRLGLRYDVTQDDVLWEVRWAADDAREADDPDGEDGAEGDDDDDRASDDDAGAEGEGADDTPGDGRARGGLALRFRPDLDVSGLIRAVEDGVPGLEGTDVVVGEQLLLRGTGEVWDTLGSRPDIAAALASDAESQLAAQGCLPWPTALGVDADVTQQEEVVASAEIEDLLDPAAWGIAVSGRDAVVSVVYPEGTDTSAAEADAAVRLALAEAWPTTEHVGWTDGFGLPPDLDAVGYEVWERGGRVVATLDYRVVNPTAAATVALAGLVPHAVCADVDWLEEPTGL